MRKASILIFISIFLIIPWEIGAQQTNQIPPTAVSMIPAEPSVRFSKVMAYLKEGGILSALLVGVENDNLILRAGGQNKKIPLNSLARVIIETEKETKRNIFHGALSGIYLGNLIFLRAENQPLAYMQDTEANALGLFLINVIFASAGGGLGYLAGSFLEKSEKTYDFTGGELKKQAEWNQLITYITGGVHRPRKLHFSIQAGHVFTRVSSQYLDLLENAGYSVYKFNPRQDTNSWDYGFVAAKDFNLVRKVQITYSLKPEIEIGVSLFSLGEPQIYGEKWRSGQAFYVSQSLYTTGLYAIGIYKPFLSQMPRGISWHIGAGLGVAKMNFNLKTEIDRGYPIYTEVITEYIISKTSFSSVIFAELNFYLSEAFSLGFSADYVFVPSEEVPEILERGIPAQKLRFGNGSIGFIIGLHF